MLQTNGKGKRSARIRIAVVGCGYWGPNLVRNFNYLPDCEMVLCCDQDKAKLKRINSLYPQVRVTNDFKRVLRSNADAVCIATPVRTHFPLAEACLRHGKHVLIEKPLADSVSHCLQLIELADKEKRVLMVGHTFEYTAAVAKIKEIIEAGELGEVIYIFSTRVNLGLFQPDINVLWDLAPHDISIINHLLDRMPQAANAQGIAHYKPGIEDVATMTLTYGNGTIAFVHNSWLDPHKTRRTTVVGTKKMLVYDDVASNEKIKIFDKGVDVPPYYDTFGEFQFSYRYGDIMSPRIEEHEPLKIECKHFLDCIAEGTMPRSDGHSGLRVVAVLEAAQRSLKNGGGAVAIDQKLIGAQGPKRYAAA